MIKASEMGITEKELLEMLSFIQCHAEVHKITVFGSRAKGNFKVGSDFDLVLSGKRITSKLINHIDYQLNEESTLPYYFDVLNINKISSQTLLQHISEEGKTLFERLA